MPYIDSEVHREAVKALLAKPPTQEQIDALIREYSMTTPEVNYKFDEGRYISELKTYVDKTYGQHYANSKLQATEFIIDMGDGLGFCRGNVIKYAKRYGQKAGYNRDDLMKVLHYALMMLHVHDKNEKDA